MFIEKKQMYLTTISACIIGAILALKVHKMYPLYVSEAVENLGMHLIWAKLDSFNVSN